MLDRSPRNLSGGERQRVGIGRALLSQPKVLLMDEPLSALDRRTKGEILPLIEKLHDHFALPIFYVTHDMTEVQRLADQMVLLAKGRVVAVGLLTELQADTHPMLATGLGDRSLSPRRDRRMRRSFWSPARRADGWSYCLGGGFGRDRRSNARPHICGRREPGARPARPQLNPQCISRSNHRDE